MRYYCGIDFGTSNSVLTVVADDPGFSAVVREPSLIYFPDDPESTARRYCGEDALRHYVSDGMSGRFFQSVKTILPDKGFTHTTINGKSFSPSDLVAVMLRYLREQAESAVGEPVERAVFGRPARFGDDDEQDTVAQDRLEQAATQAGFTEAVFELEPVAGAHAYAERAINPERGDGEIVLVADHGGGTSDFTLFVLGVDDDHLPVARRVLATYGIRAGGDDFDGAIMWNRLADYFGYGSHYESFGKLLPIPVHIYHIISRWDRIHFLKTLKYREELHYFLRSADNPLAIRRLIKLVEEDLGYFLFRAIESAKIRLSDTDRATVSYENGKLRVDEAITRPEFERYIDDDVTRIAAAVDRTLGAGGVEATRKGRGGVTTVFLTGGSSRVPAIRRVMEERFGPDAVIDDTDQFQSVSRGLALTAKWRGLTTLPVATE